MRVVWAFMRANWLAASSYRLAHVYSIFGLLFGIVPLYFVAKAIQPVAAGSVAGQGGDFFAFVVVGMVAQFFLMDAVNAVPGAVGSSISSGTFDTLVSVPTPLPVVYAAMSAYGFSWTIIRAMLTLGFAAVLGANVEWSRLALGFLILLILVLAYLPIGLLSAAMIVAFRTDGPIRTIVVIGSTLLGGVFWNPQVIPVALIRQLSAFVPLTYGLRSLRRVILEGTPFSQVMGDLGAMMLFVLILLPIGLLALRAAFDYARRAGTLAQY